jgi:spermidine synthase
MGTDQLLAVGATALFAAVTLVAIVERLPLSALVAGGAVVAAATIATTVAPERGSVLRGAAAQNWSPIYRLRGQGGPQGEVDFAAEGARVLFRKDTAYHRLAVVQSEETRYLRFDASLQSGMPVGKPFGTAFTYTDFFHLAFAYDPNAREILHIGLGGASSIKRMWHDFPDVQLQAVEIDPVVADVAHKYFALPRDRRIKVAVEDGRRYLRTHPKKWDAIVIDAFYSDSVPFHMTTQEFLELAHSRLKPGGLILTNVIGSLRGDGSELFRSFFRTYSTVFPTVRVHPVKESGLENDFALRNLIVVATDGAAPNEAFLERRWKQIRADHPTAPDLTKAIRDRYATPVRTDDVPTLTDDYAPTDALLVG